MGLALFRPLPLGGGLAAAFGIFVLVTIISGVFNEGERAILKSLVPVSMLRK
jgi:hypothetical protein